VPEKTTSGANSEHHSGIILILAFNRSAEHRSASF